jgi:hypothetical protein
MKGANGIQMSLHKKFHSLFQKIKTDRIIKGKDTNNSLSDKRLSLTLVKLFESNKSLYDLIINAEINKNEI